MSNEVINLAVMKGHDGTYKGKVNVMRILPDHTQEKIYSLFAVPLRTNQEDALKDAQELRNDLLREVGQ